MSEYKWNIEMNMYMWSEDFEGTLYLFRYNHLLNTTEYALEGYGYIEWIYHAKGNTAPRDIRAHATANQVARFNSVYDEREDNHVRWDGVGTDPYNWSRPLGSRYKERRRAQSAAQLRRTDSATAPHRWTTGIDGRPMHLTVGIDGRPVIKQEYNDWLGGQKRFRKSRRHNKRARTKKSKKSRQTKRIR